MQLIFKINNTCSRFTSDNVTNVCIYGVSKSCYMCELPPPVYINAQAFYIPSSNKAEMVNFVSVFDEADFSNMFANAQWTPVLEGSDTVAQQFSMMNVGNKYLNLLIFFSFCKA